MNSLIEMAAHYVPNADFTAVVLDASLKSFVVLVLAGGLCLGCRRASAATRHLIWFLATVSLACWPLLSTLLPSWHRPLWSVSASMNSGNQFSLALELAAVAEPAFRPGPVPLSATKTGNVGLADSRPVGKPRLAAHFSAGWLVLAWGVWLGGVLLVLTSIGVARLRLHRLARSARPPVGVDWTSLLREVRTSLNVRRPVVLLQSSDNQMPVTWGFWQPVVLLPAEADQWSPERRRIVLWHEFAHVKRWDCLTQMASRMVGAFYWFNPLVWTAVRRMGAERERACDDLVLNGGCRASDYASHLVEIALAFRPVPRVTAIAMTRSSGLPQRVAAILDANLERNGVAKLTVVLGTLAVVGSGLFAGGCATPAQHPAASWSFEQSEVAAQLRRFAAEKKAQANAAVKLEGKEMLPEFNAMFAAAAKGNWLAISNIFEDLRVRAPQYDLPGRKDERLHGTAWQAVLEIWGAFGNIAAGGEKRVVGLARDSIESISPSSIYFGGTDPGRFVITALCDSQINGDPFFTITQNALADNSYLTYVRSMYGAKIQWLTAEDSARCFQEYSADAQRRLEHDRDHPNEPRQLKPGEDVKMVEGKLQVSGQSAVMAINGLLAKMIFERNPDREFYLEESFPLDWMYPHLSPNGPILKINRQPVAELSDDVIRQDHAYWTRCIQPMIGDWLKDETSLQEIAAFAAKVYPNQPKTDRYIRNDAAQKWASKLRSSIAGIYVWRLDKAATEAEKARMVREADFAFRQAFALCPYSPEAVFRYVNLLVSQNRESDALLVAETAARLYRENKMFQNLVDQLKTAKKN